jgi:NAD(P)-dependent dehydrogenase (short-subunit alcohol dehydrogenase family)
MSGKVVLLTGGGGALGQVSAELFAREGASVTIIDAVKNKAEETAHRISANGGNTIAIHANITNEAAVRDAISTSIQHWGRLDTLFNNAGIMPHQDESILNLDFELLTQIYVVNLGGTALCCKYTIPHIINAGGGAVVNMGSFLAVMGCTKPQDAYSASKGAIIALTRSLAVQFGKYNIRVNALCPGPIETEHVTRFFPNEEDRRVRLDRIPLGRFGRPEDVAELALYLASDAASWLTGQAIVLDGGISCNYF